MAKNAVVPLIPPIHTDRRDMGMIWDRAIFASRTIKKSVLLATRAAIVSAVLMVGNPLALFANARVLLVDISASQNNIAQSMPVIKLTADVRNFAATEKKGPTSEEIAPHVKTVGQRETESQQPPPEALLKRFQAWARKEDQQLDLRPVRSAEDA